MRRRAPMAAIAAAVAVVVAMAAGCGDSGHSGEAAAGTHGDHASTAAQGFEGGVVSPRREAPPLQLTDIDGKAVDIRDLRGHPVLVTFVYANCPDVCPLIMENLHRVRELAGPLGKRMRVIAVSVDPAGDTPAVVRRFLAAHQVRSFVDYGIGDRATLERVWADWQVSTQAPKDDPEAIEHSSLIYGVTAGGELATAYPVGFEAESIARDLPLLARS
ncbi:MAG TPA: SCO family protein [Miltoncostaeaceae bacterium]|nr:SCO family protein [Miltoncostaeaceae bacterium]